MAAALVRSWIRSSRRSIFQPARSSHSRGLLRPLLFPVLGLFVSGCEAGLPALMGSSLVFFRQLADKGSSATQSPITDAELKAKLTPDQYHVCREGGTEKPFSGKFYQHWEKGRYTCACCGEQLFSSETKYDSGSGWPSFTAPDRDDNIEYITDNSLGMKRTEVRCKKCGCHLGHVFDDGPAPTGQRYCINSLSLDFDKQEDKPSDGKNEL